MEDPLKAKILAYNRQVPRYTSYPPATRFVSLFDGAFYTDALRKVSGDISLYLHIPFCTKLCHYCGCHMQVINNYNLVPEYLKLILRESKIIRSFLPKDVEVKEIHFGGGSPTIIGATDFLDFVDRLKTIMPFSPDGAISLEADPRHLSEAKIASYARSGAKRLSLGVQDFNHEIMASINRVQPYRLTRDAVLMARDYGIKSLNFDLMYGLPKQTISSLTETINMAVRLRPDRVSFFGYAHVPWLKKHMRLLPEKFLPDSELRYDLYKTGERILLEFGYVPVGIDHFVLPDDGMAQAMSAGKLRRNFQGYTTDPCETLIGMGTSSISKVSGLYAQNHVGMPVYRQNIERGVLPVSRGGMLDETDKIYAEIIESLMCRLSVDLNRIAGKSKKNVNIFAQSVEKLGPFIRDGFVDFHEGKIKIRDDARLMVRLICQAFDQYAGSESRHAVAI